MGSKHERYGGSASGMGQASRGFSAKAKSKRRREKKYVKAKANRRTSRNELTERTNRAQLTTNNQAARGVPTSAAPVGCPAVHEAARSETEVENKLNDLHGGEVLLPADGAADASKRIVVVPEQTSDEGEQTTKRDLDKEE
jgi:hypothetical protein